MSSSRLYFTSKISVGNSGWVMKAVISGFGSQVSLASSTEDNAVEVITQVTVTDACASDEHATLPMLEALMERGQEPEEMVANTAFGSGDNAVQAERLGTELVSPVRKAPRWKSRTWRLSNER